MARWEPDSTVTWWLCDDQGWGDQRAVGALRAHPFGSSGATRASQGRARQTYVPTLGSAARFIFSLLYIRINRLIITLISNGRSLLAHIYVVRAGLTKVQVVPTVTALHYRCFFSPNQLRSTQPSPLLFPVCFAALAMKSFSFSLLTAALFVVGVSAQEIADLVLFTPSVLLVLPPRTVLSIYSISCSGRTWFDAHLLQ